MGTELGRAVASRKPHILSVITACTFSIHRLYLHEFCITLFIFLLTILQIIHNSGVWEGSVYVAV